MAKGKTKHRRVAGVFGSTRRDLTIPNFAELCEVSLDEIYEAMDDGCTGQALIDRYFLTCPRWLNYNKAKNNFLYGRAA